MSSTRLNQLDVKMLDDILTNIMETVTNSKNDIFEIGEQSREECEALLKELEDLNERAAETGETRGRLEEDAEVARRSLAKADSDSESRDEREIQVARERVKQVQAELAAKREESRRLKEKRDDLERKLTGLRETVQRSETLAGQMSVVLGYMNGDLRQVGEMVEDARKKQAFGLRVIEAQEEERRRLSREIHDGPAQTLAHVLLGSELVEKMQKEKGPEAAAEEFDHLRKMIRQALYDVRRIIYDLRPMTLDDLGLVPTLEKYLYRVEDEEKVGLSFQQVGEPGRLPPKMEAALFRMVQEAVQNGCKHANAEEIRVRMDFSGSAVLLLIRDDGKGFDPGEEKKGAFGMMGMRERVDLLEGEISIESAAGQGTAIMIQIPVHNQGDVRWQNSIR
ncbi:MAG TPA: sensor histidine kinase [Bacillales bacterium]|nr:sensor histidine kinase [Bacillales bacterium]